MRKVTVQVPATSANLGPGFDCLGLAFALYTTVCVEEIEKGIEITGCEKAYQNEQNLCFIAYKKVFEKLSIPLKGVHIHMDAHIPISRGLGSSASLVVGGIVAANKMCYSPLSTKEMLQLATEIEGHPDNVAPALLGGLTVALKKQTDILYASLPLAPALEFCALIPDFETSTCEARKQLPFTVPFQDAVFNVSHVALLLSALQSGNSTHMAEAFQDALHQPYRAHLIHDYDKVKAYAKEGGALAFCISGSGSTCLAVCKDAKAFQRAIQQKLHTLPHHWQALPLCVDKEGAKIKE